jgi:hypothetical protein
LDENVSLWEYFIDMFKNSFTTDVMSASETISREKAVAVPVDISARHLRVMSFLRLIEMYLSIMEETLSYLELCIIRQQWIR